MKKIKVLPVDDHSMVRAGIKDFLSRAEHIHVVGEAQDGIEAQSMIAKVMPDIVLVDIEMPNLNGIELTRWIRKHHNHIKVMMLSSYDEEEYVMASLKAGANGYSLKNTSPAKLIEAINDIAADKAALDPGIAMKVINLAKHENEEVIDFTAREKQILQLVAEGKTNKDIGERLFISNRTVQGHLSKIFAKLEVETRTEAAMKATKAGIISINDNQ